MANKKLQKQVQIDVEARRQQINKDVSIYSIFFAEIKQVYIDYAEDLIDDIEKNIKDKELKKLLITKLRTKSIPVKKISKIYKNAIADAFDASTGLHFIKETGKNYFYAEDSNGYHFILLPKEEGKNIPYSIIQTAQRKAKEKIDKTLEQKKVGTKNYLDFLLSFAAEQSDVGHERSASAVELSTHHAAIRKLKRYRSINRNIKSELKSAGTAIQKFEEEIEIVEGWNDLAVDLVKNTLKGEYTFGGISVLKFESRRTNRKKGKHTATLVKVFEDFVVKHFPEYLRKRNSKSILDTLEDDIIALFLGKKTKPLKKRKGKQETTKVKSKKITPKRKIKAKITDAPDIVLAREIFALLDKKGDPDLNSKIPYLNRRLHDKIQQNMGKGRSKKILNYRTGRFARSAEIERFTPSREKGAVNAQVKYMRFPYGTFEPGGRLHLPGRNPERIFARSIRQLLQEEKIATLRRVKVQLRG